MKVWFYVLDSMGVGLGDVAWGSLPIAGDPENIFSYQATLSPGLPRGNYLLDTMVTNDNGIPSFTWPYLKVTN